MSHPTHAKHQSLQARAVRLDVDNACGSPPSTGVFLRLGHVKRLTRMADMPGSRRSSRVARWRGFGGVTNSNGAVSRLTWAAASAAHDQPPCSPLACAGAQSETRSPRFTALSTSAAQVAYALALVAP